MTAPDMNAYVRARFEAWMTWQGASIQRDGPYYTSAYTNGAWAGYRAAHADLSGEVRELVEALDVARGKVNHVHLSLANNRVVGGSFSVDDETSCRWTGSLNIAGARLDDIRRALAKHTHQETK